MKNLLKSLVLTAILIFTFGETVQAQFRVTAKPSTPASVVQFYKNYRSSGKGCVGMTIATNEVSKIDVAIKPPVTTWATARMGTKPNGLKSGPAKRFWSSRYDGNQPFADNKTDMVEIVLTKVGNNVQAKMIKNGSSTFNINILGMIAKGKGHVLYGTYGNHGGFITISLYKTFCPEG